MRRILVGAIAIFAFGAHAAPVTIQDGFIQAGVNDYGTLGSIGSASPGILYDQTGTGTYGVNDFLTPGNPLEGFYITADGSYEQFADNSAFMGGTFTAAAPSLLTAKSAGWSSTTTDGSLMVANTYLLSTLGGRSVIEITTVLTNIGAALDDVQFLRVTDPDPDWNVFGTHVTHNTRVSNDQVCATGVNSGETMCLGTDAGLTHNVGISTLWKTDPASYLAGVNDQPDDDNLIGLAFDIGDLAAGDSVMLNYWYAFGPTLPVASDAPEPASLLLVAAGLAGLGLVRRKRRG